MYACNLDKKASIDDGIKALQIKNKKFIIKNYFYEIVKLKEFDE